MNNTIDAVYDAMCKREGTQYPGMIPFMAVLAAYAHRCHTIAELGVRTGNSSVAFLAGMHAGTLYSYDLNLNPLTSKNNPAHRLLDLDEIKPGLTWERAEHDTLSGPIGCGSVDMLFIDTWHTGAQLTAELSLNVHLAREYIILHDVEAFAWTGQGKRSPGTGLLPAVLRFLADAYPQWHICRYDRTAAGLMVLTTREDG